MFALLPYFLAGGVLGFYEAKDNRNPSPPVQGPLEFRDYLDRTSWINPIPGTIVDQYVVGGAILVLLYKLVK